jgi:HAD superfamily hydrolase (TIGR01509 family)
LREPARERAALRDRVRAEAFPDRVREAPAFAFFERAVRFRGGLGAPPSPTARAARCAAPPTALAALRAALPTRPAAVLAALAAVLATLLAVLATVVPTVLPTAPAVCAASLTPSASVPVRPLSRSVVIVPPCRYTVAAYRRKKYTSSGTARGPFPAFGGPSGLTRRRRVRRLAAMPPRTLFLDAGGVLVNPNWTRVSETLARHGVMAGTATLAAAEPHAKRELDGPARDRAHDDDSRGWLYFNLVLAHAGIARSAHTDAALAELRAYHGRYNLWETVPAETAPALRALRAQGLRLVVVSNSNGTLKYKMERLGLTPLVDVLFDSFEERVEKPDPRFFQIALERSGADPARTLHVGDLYSIDVVGARAAGLRAVLFDAAGLYPDVDCPRVASLTELAEAYRTGVLT